MTHNALEVNNYIQSWQSLNYKFPKSDSKMICSYNYSKSKDIIIIIGGWNMQSTRSVYHYNIPSNTFNTLTELVTDAASVYPNGFVTAATNDIYFTNANSFDSTNNFWVYDIVNNALVKQGHIDPKPKSVGGECYTTDNKQHIYIIGGRDGIDDPISGTYIYDVSQHKWTNGPELNISRVDAGCTYNIMNSIIYVFAGSGKLGNFNSIEKYDTLHSNQSNHSSYTKLTNVVLTNSVSSIKAFMMSNSDIIFIMGSNYPMFCNMFTVSTQQINLCPIIEGVSNAAVYCGARVQTDEFNRYYTFGMNGRNIIYYAIIGPSVVSFSTVVNVVLSGQRVPIIVNKIAGDTDAIFDAQIRCDELNLNYIMRYTANNCTLCDKNHKININEFECVDCLSGILLPKTMNGQNVTCNNIIEENYQIQINKNINITYFQQYLVFNISNIDGQNLFKFVASELYILLHSHFVSISYNFTIIFGGNVFSPNIATLSVTLKNETALQECDILYENVYSKCENGISPNIISREDPYTTVQIMSEKPQNFTVFPLNKTLTKMQQFINLTTSAKTIFAGESIPIIINNNNSLFWMNNMYKFNMLTKQNAFKINDILHINVSKQAINQCLICKDDANIYNFNYNNISEECIDCQQGVIPTIDSRFIKQQNTTFSILFDSINNNVTIYPIGGLPIKIQICPRGYGISSDSCANCIECGYNKFMLTASVKPCYSCNQIKGVKCDGGANIMISYNYWVSALSNSSEFHALIEYENDDTIYATYCPSGFCCSSLNGCNYIEAYDNINISSNNPRLCSFGRDPSSILCSKCETGKSELFGSANCGECTTTNYSLLSAIICIIILPLSIYIIYFESVAALSNENKNESKNEFSYDLQTLNSLVFDVYFYFYQALSVILTSKGYDVSQWAVSAASIINLEPTHIDSNRQNSGFCVIANINSLQELLVSLIYPLLFIPILVIIAILEKYTSYNRLKHFVCCCCVSCFNTTNDEKDEALLQFENEIDEKIEINDNTGKCNYCHYVMNAFDREPFVKTSAYRLFLMYVGSTITVLFQLNTFIKLPNEDYVFYIASYKLFTFTDPLFIVCVCAFIGVLFSVTFVFIKLKLQTTEERKLPNNNLRAFVQSFTEEAWFWQFIILLRRCCISVFAAFQFLQPLVLNIALSFIIFVCVVLNDTFQPFKYRIANYMETLCLCCLAMILIGLNYVDDRDSVYFDAFIGFFIFAPLIIFIALVVRVLWKFCKLKCCCLRRKKQYALNMNQEKADIIQARNRLTSIN